MNAADQDASPPGVSTAGAEWPRILAFSEEVLSTAHGTGVAFARNFAGYPRDALLNVYCGVDSPPLLPRVLDLKPHRWPPRFWPPAAALTRLRNFAARLVRSDAPPTALPADRRRIARALAATGFTPDLVYASFMSQNAVRTLAAVLTTVPRRTPVILHVHDLFSSLTPSFRRDLRALAARATELWAVDPAIIAHAWPGARQPVRIDRQLHIAVPAEMKRQHRPAGPDFTAIVIGNIYNPALLSDLRSAWAQCRAARPDLPPIRWYCHPAGVARVREAGVVPEPEVIDAGFIAPEQLHATLLAADLAILPFARGATAASNYEKYSLPSRVADLCAAGLPFVTLSGSGTPVHAFVTERQLGPCVPASDTPAVAATLHELINSHAQRAEFGRRGRALAEAEFDLADHQRWLYAHLRALARGVPADS